MDKYNKALEYEIFVKKEYGFADQSIKQSKIIFDVGGHIGLFSKYCLSLNPGCEIHYFEPIPNLYNQAKQSLKNQKVIFNNFGISAKTGQQYIYYNPQKTMQSSSFNKTFLNPKGEKKLVKMQNLQEYCAQQNISQIDLLKLDVEGMEYEIIDSLSDEFLQKIQALLLEFHIINPEMNNILDSLKKRLSSFFIISQIPNSYNHLVGYLFLLKKF